MDFEKLQKANGLKERITRLEQRLSLMKTWKGGALIRFSLGGTGTEEIVLYASECEELKRELLKATELQLEVLIDEFAKL